MHPVLDGLPDTEAEPLLVSGDLDSRERCRVKDRPAWQRLAKPATGSEKNITPNRSL